MQIGRTVFTLDVLQERFDHGRCPVCATRLTGTSSLTEDGEEPHRPKEREFTVCTECGNVLQFDVNLRLSTASKTDLEELEQEQPDHYNAMMRLSGLFRKSIFLGKLKGAGEKLEANT